MCQAKRGRTGRASRDTNALRSVDSPRNLRLPGRNSRVGCVKQSADAPVAQAETLPVGRHALDPPYKFQMPDVRTRSRVGCVKQSAGRTGRASRDTPGGSAAALDPPYKFQMPDVRTRSRVGCVKQSADAPVAQAETLPVGRQLRWTHPTNSRCPMCVPGAA